MSIAKWIGIVGLSMVVSMNIGAAFSEEGSARKELKRADLITGAVNVEVISSISTYKPGEMLKRHLHHGIEAGYVIQGATIEIPGKGEQKLPTGADVMNLTKIAHGGFKIVGETPLIIFTVHVVDKNQPLYDWITK